MCDVRAPRVDEQLELGSGPDAAGGDELAQGPVDDDDLKLQGNLRREVRIEHLLRLLRCDVACHGEIRHAAIP